jgi:hypothetical protein
MPFLYFIHKDFQPSREMIQPFQRGRFLFFFASCRQGFGSGGSGSVCIGSGFNQPYVLDPDSIRSVDPDSYSDGFGFST